MRHLRLFAALLLGLLFVGTTAPSLLAADEQVLVPDVAGRTPDEARQMLETSGLAPLLVPVAGPPVGKVEKQDPQAGTKVARGAQVLVRYGIALRLETRVPDLRNKVLGDVGPDVEGAYTLDVELIFDTGEPDGQILEQNPAPGSMLWYRGVLALKVRCKQCHSGTVVVPAVVGLSEAEALERLESAGLHALLDYRPEPSQAEGLVSAQDPRSGAELLYGGTVYLRVSGNPPPEPPQVPPTPAPKLVGLDMNVALNTAQSQGFRPQLSFKVGGGFTPWTVMAQDPAAGTPLAAGLPLTLVVSLPGPAPAQVAVPSLFGLAQNDALQILTALGLGMQVELKQVGFPLGLVFSQQPAPGALIPRGQVVTLSISQGPGPQGPPTAQMPALVGLSALQAFQKIQLAGLSPKGFQHLAPNQPLDVVDAQSPAPGAIVPVGSEARFFVPSAGLVPTLLGRTRSQAIALLQAEGFNADPQGPAFGLGSTLVIAQSAPAGVPLARGSTVAFAYKFQQGGGMPVKVQVPNVVGGTKNEAVALLQQHGLGVNLVHQGPVVPGPGTKVTGQAPQAGALVSPGHIIHVHYIEIAGPGGLVAVPHLIGKSLQQAQQALFAVGLAIDPHLQGVNLPNGIRKVVAQVPAAGAFLAAGTQVKVIYVEQLPAPPQPLVNVPPLLGKTKTQAQAILSGLGLTWKFNGPGGNPNKLKVVMQAPVSGAKVQSGSQVTMLVIPIP